MRTFVFVTLCSLTHALTSLVMKMGMERFGKITIDHVRHPFSLVLNLMSEPFILLGLVLIFISLFLYYLIVSRTRLSFAFLATRSLAYILVILFSWVFLKEVLTLKAFLGIAIILVGIYLIS